MQFLLKNITAIESAAIFEKELASLPLFLQQEILIQKNSLKQKQSLLGKILLRDYLLEKELPISILETWQRDESQKPHCQGIYSFSISHSGDWVGVAISQKNKLGLDIQQLRKFEKIDLFRSYFHKEEWDWLLSQNDQDAAFIELWVRKESFLKLLGIGIILNTNHFSVVHNSFYFNDYLYDFQQVIVANGYKAVVCEMKNEK